MDNQHRSINGCRELDAEEIELMNEIKNKGTEIEVLAAKLRDTDGIDLRWLNIAVTHLQQGLMAMTRAVARPTTF